ncbi:MAG: transglycosylase domain-containing protein [Actinomycetota bacterium]
MASRSARRRPRARATSRARPRRGRTRWQRFLIRYGWLLPLGALLIGGSLLLMTYAFARIPLPADIELTSSAEVYDVHGRLIGTYSDEVKRFLIDTDDLPDYVGDAVVASEDRSFYEHNGVSIRGIARAAWANLTGGEVQQGGSTITQQYIKNAVLKSSERTVTRKAKEAILAIKLERKYSKDEILGFYLNTIYLGRGAYGVEAAARTYFGHKHATELTLGEAAYLASIIPSPETYQPDENPRGARDRRDRVLALMAEEGYVSTDEATRAARGRVRLSDEAKEDVKPQKAAYFLEWLRKDYLEPEFGGRLFTSGFKIYTTLDLEMQQEAEAAISTKLVQKTEPQAALVSMTPRGEVRAFVGGRDFTNVKKARGFNYASDPPGRSTGSSAKPFTLLSAIEEGISPQSRFSGSSPARIDDPECAGSDPTSGAVAEWEVENFANSQYGTIDLVTATTNSVNTVYAQLVAEVGPEKVADTLGEFGFRPQPGEDRIVPYCSLALGILDATPLEQARAYAGFAGRGALPEAAPIRFILDAEEDCLIEYGDQKGQRCDERKRVQPDQVAELNEVDVLNQTLTGVVSGGTATAAALPGREAAGKTGTTQDHTDAWFAGYTPQLATVVWMGYPIDFGSITCDAECSDKELDEAAADDFIPRMEFCEDPEICRPVAGDLGYPIAVTGGSFPARIWHDFMVLATEGMEVVPFPTPEDLPDEVINRDPDPEPVYTGEPTESPTESPTEEPSASPSETPSEPPPSPDPSPPPSPTPSVVPSSSPRGDEARGGKGKNGGP